MPPHPVWEVTLGRLGRPADRGAPARSVPRVVAAVERSPARSLSPSRSWLRRTLGVGAGIPLLKFGPSWPATMKANTALAFILRVPRSSRHGRGSSHHYRLARACRFAVVLLQLATLGEYASVGRTCRPDALSGPARSMTAFRAGCLLSRRSASRVRKVALLLAKAGRTLAFPPALRCSRRSVPSDISNTCPLPCLYTEVALHLWPRDAGLSRFSLANRSAASRRSSRATAPAERRRADSYPWSWSRRFRTRMASASKGQRGPLRTEWAWRSSSSRITLVLSASYGKRPLTFQSNETRRDAVERPSAARKPICRVCSILR